MSDEWYTRLVQSGRLSVTLAEKRRSKESPDVAVAQPSGASRGLLASHLSDHVKLIRSLIKMSGLSKRGHNNARRIRINELSIDIPQLPESFHGFKLMHLSDLHLDMAPDIADVIAARVQPIAADATVITGDFRAATAGPVAPTVAAFEKVLPHLPRPVYAVLGNHDSLQVAAGLENLGLRLLFNEHVLMQRDNAQIAIVGVDDPHFFQTDDLDAALVGIPHGVPKILLAHSPEIYADAERSGIDFMLAGHTHGGQICLPGGYPVIVNADCPRRYCRGFWRHEQLRGYTSVGTGSSVVDVRFNCPPEIALHTLVAA
ncbi:MAG: metallophosphoesterase [Gammaproteobacteria bacterium]|nr:metallophosphoesterase [Gammaproteobacteria bacterium]